MRKSFFALILAFSCLPAVAKDKVIPLSQEDAEKLAGKTIALTVHERPSFSAMTAGKASFALLGAGAMIAAGNKLVDENEVQDPAGIVRTQLVSSLQDAYAIQFLPVDEAVTKATKPKELAALHPDADYVLDVRSGGWMFAYYPTRWSNYWVGYSVQVQLVDTQDGRQVSNLACNSNTQDNPVPITRDELIADEARLLKDITASLGWKCYQLLAEQQFGLAPGQIALIPSELVDPLAPARPAADDSGVANPEQTDANGEAGQVDGNQGSKGLPGEDSEQPNPAAEADAIEGHGPHPGLDDGN